MLLDSYIVIIDYKMGNLRSVQKAFEKVGANVVVSNDHAVIKKAQKIVLPGVGSFRDGMLHLKELGLVDLLHEEVLVKKKPFLGICLGMHLISKLGYEGGETEGLNWVDAEVLKFEFDRSELKIPHVGWNEVMFKNNNLLYGGVKEGEDFYFVHSYYFKTKEDVISTYTDYGFNFISSIQKNNIYAFQFHPEKSHISGLRLLENFVDLKE